MVFVVFPITETVWRWKLSVACLPGLQVQGWAPAWLWTVKKHLRKKGRKGWGEIPGRNEPLYQNAEARARWWWASGEEKGNSNWELGKRAPLDSPAQEQPWGFFFFKIYLYLFCPWWVFVAAPRLFSSCGEWGLLSSSDARASHCSGFSCFGAGVQQLQCMRA